MNIIFHINYIYDYPLNYVCQQLMGALFTF